MNDLEKVCIQNENSINLVREKRNSNQNNLKILAHSRTKFSNNITVNHQAIKNLKTDLAGIEVRLKELQGNIKDSSKNKAEYEQKIGKQEQEFAILKKDITEKTSILNSKRRLLEQIKENKNKVEIDLSSIKKDLFQLEEVSFKELNMELKHIEAADEALEEDISSLEEKVKTEDERLIKMRDSNRLNFSAESEYNLLNKDYQFLHTQQEDILKSIDDMNEAIERIDNESKTSFIKAFEQVKKNFKKNFQILFDGGEAELNLNDPDGNILEAGLEIKAQPPGKRLQSLKLLSGGEKTLTSLSFLFAMFEYKPSPFCVFDEVDASLDEANIQKFLQFLHKLKQKTQFLIITHNFKTMEEADYLYGVSMEEPGISTIYSLKMTNNGELQTRTLE